MSHGIPAFRNCNIRQGQIDATEWVYLRKEALIENPRSVVHYQDIIMARSGCPGIACSVPSEYDGYSAVDILIASVFTDYISSCFIEKNINSQTIQNRIAIINRGVALSHIGVTTIDKLLLPIPPFVEQQRIVSCIEQLFVLCDTIDKADENLENTVSLARQKVLDLAIRGQLVPQNPDDEPASELLKRIQAEKAAQVKAGKRKADKRESTITRGGDNRYYENVNGKATDITDQIPFEIPPSWEWCRLGMIIQLLSGRDLQPNSYSASEKGIPYITGASNFDNGNIIINRWTTCPEVISEKDDLLFTCKGTIGETAFNNIGKVHIARQIMALRSYGALCMPYLSFVLKKHISIIQETAHGIIPGISRDDMLAVLIPFPPLAEQMRIVDAVSMYEQLLIKLL